MRSTIAKLTLTASLVLATTLVLSCSSDGGGGGDNPSDSDPSSSSVDNGAGDGISESYDIKIEPLLKTEWDQSREYALFAPQNKSLGCGSAAYAQILFYHGLVPSGQVSYTDKDWKVTLTEDFDNPRVDMDKVVPRIKGEFSNLDPTPEENNIETARYIWYVAMAYRSENLEKHFPISRSSSMRYPERTKDDMEDFIISELSEKRPLYLHIEKTLPIVDNHALVIDGIRKNANQTLVHLNLGWGGGDNGWYDLWQLIRTTHHFNEPDRSITAVRPHGAKNLYENKFLKGFYGTYRADDGAVVEITSDSLILITESSRKATKVDSYTYRSNTDAVTKAAYPAGYRILGKDLDRAYYFNSDFSSIVRLGVVYTRYNEESPWCHSPKTNMYTVRCSAPSDPVPSDPAPSDPVSSGPVEYEGETYPTVIIGSQIWFAKNLNVAGGKCYSNLESNCEKYGSLYDWATAMNLPSDCNASKCSLQAQGKHKGICPDGWHIPDGDDWDILKAYAGGSSAGQYLKAESGWNSGNGYYIYGFAALPGGQGDSDGNFLDVGNNGYWWENTESTTSSRAYRRRLSKDDDKLNEDTIDKASLQSVRCVKD